MPRPVLARVGGYVLAGGRSSRMGTDKALLPLAGKPLIAHATEKLHDVGAEVSILSSNPALARYAPLVADIHHGCGPMGAMEAGLLHSHFDWNLFLPVDMPFLPAAFLREWVAGVGREGQPTSRICLFTIAGRPHPALCLLHKEVAPLLTAALDRGEFKLMPAFTSAARMLASRHGISPAAGLSIGCASEDGTIGDEAESGARADPRWFANLNTPEDFASAEVHAAAIGW